MASPVFGDDDPAAGLVWVPGREVNPDDPGPNLIRQVFDAVFALSLTCAINPEAVPDEFEDVLKAFIDFMDDIDQEYIAATEPAYIWLRNVPWNDFVGGISLERWACYFALAPLTMNQDPFLPDADTELAEVFFRLAHLLNVPRTLLMDALWRGRWRHAKFWGREFQALHLEMNNSTKRSKRATAQERARQAKFDYLDVAFNATEFLETQGEVQNAMENALYRAWLQRQDAEEKPKLTLVDGAWEQAGKLAGLKLRERQLLAKRAVGEVRRTKDNGAAWESLRTQYPKIRDVLPAVLNEQLLTHRFAHPLIAERVNEKNISFTFKGIGV